MLKNFKFFFNYFLVPVLLIWLGVNLYNQINQQHNKNDSWQQIKNAFISNGSWRIYFAMFLMFVNWAIEAWKWKLLIAPLQKVSFYTAYKAIFAGTSFAANTPNRVGEYFGRMIYIDEGKRLESIPLTVTGSFSQLIVTLIAGTIGLFFYININNNIPNPTISSFWLEIFFVGALFISLICLLVYFKLSWIVAGLTRIPFIHKYEYFFKKIDSLHNAILWKVLCLSILRYGVFLMQYILIMDAFGVSVNLYTSICLLTVLFLVMSIVPSFVILEAGIRGTVSIEIFKVVTTNEVGILATGLFIWLINLMAPAVIGVLLLIGKKLFKR